LWTKSDSRSKSGHRNFLLRKQAQRLMEENPVLSFLSEAGLGVDLLKQIDVDLIDQSSQPPLK
jgi:predicted transcriptional regulator